MSVRTVVVAFDALLSRLARLRGRCQHPRVHRDQSCYARTVRWHHGSHAGDTLVGKSHEVVQDRVNQRVPWSCGRDLRGAHIHLHLRHQVCRQLPMIRERRHQFAAAQPAERTVMGHPVTHHGG